MKNKITYVIECRGYIIEEEGQEEWLDNIIELDTKEEVREHICGLPFVEGCDYTTTKHDLNTIYIMVDKDKEKIMSGKVKWIEKLLNKGGFICSNDLNDNKEFEYTLHLVNEEGNKKNEN